MNGRLQIALWLMIPMLGVSAARAAEGAYVGPYAGGDVLMARLNPKRVDIRDINVRDSHLRNDKDLGWKGLVGVRMTPHFAFEAGFMDFGKAVATPAVSRPLQAQTKAFTAFGVGIMPAGKVDLFAKAGPSRTESMGHVGGAYFDRQERKIGYGTGVQLVKRRLLVRLEYEKFGASPIGDLSAVSLGFRLSFHTVER